MKKISFIFKTLFLLFSTNFYAEKITFPVSGLLTVGDEPIPVEVEWNESWFGRKSSFKYDHDIARIAALLSEISYVDVQSDLENNPLIQTYRLLGIKDDDIEMHYDVDYSKPVLGNDQAAFSFASKTIQSSKGKSTLVFVTIRGTPVNANEWISNVNISDTTRKAASIHEGFFHTTEQIHKELIYYLLKKNIDPRNVFFLITGHSRGGAVSNLLGAMINDEEYFNTNCIYDYTFAAPNVSTDEKVSDEKYKFIWNIVNAEDLVPTVPPDRNGWKYKKFGNTVTLVNYWNTDQDIYDNEYIPRMNKYFERFLNRAYSPFRTGPFIPTQISRILTNLYENVSDYYSSVTGLRQKLESVFWRIFPEDNPEGVLESIRNNSENNQKNVDKKTSVMENLAESLNKYTNGLFNYATEAFVDMHAGETYLSWMLALNEEEVFSELGSSQIWLGQSYEAAVFDKNDNVVAKISDGLIQFKSIKQPIIACPYPNKTVIGFPANDEFKVAVYKDCLTPTMIPTRIEHYDAAGVAINFPDKKNLFPHKGIGYIFDAGTITMRQAQIQPKKVKGKELKELRKKGNLYPKQDIRIQPEINIDTDFHLGFGINVGCQNIYGSLLTYMPMTKLGTTFELATGVCHQECLYGPIFIDSSLFGKFFWAVEDERDFSFVPSIRLSLTYKPYRRFQLFVATDFDLHIEEFNDDAFKTNVREGKIGKINLSSKVNILPELRFGVKF